jgi:hypothetical protein
MLAVVFSLFTTAALAQTPTSSSHPPAHVVCDPCAVNFGTVPVGESRWTSVTLVNTGGTATTITSETHKASSLTLRGLNMPYILGKGRTVRFRIIFEPQNGSKTRDSILYYTKGSTPVITMSATGVGAGAGTLHGNPAQLNFGGVAVGQSKTERETITNTGSRAVTLQSVTASGEFSLQGIATPITLEPKHSVTFEAKFAPTKAGAVSGQIHVATDTRGTQLAIGESGDGTANGTLRVSPNQLSFGNVTVGSSKTLPVTLSASGSSVTVTSDSLGSSEYTASGLSLPLTVSPGKNVTFQVSFVPQSPGQANSNLGLNTSGGSSVSVPVAGDGVAATQHSVSLSWQPDASGVSGYNVYRRGPGNSGNYKRINTSLDSSPSYLDGSVQGGDLYSYYVTAVNGQGVESAPSNYASVSIPSN